MPDALKRAAPTPDALRHRTDTAQRRARPSAPGSVAVKAEEPVVAPPVDDVVVEPPPVEAADVEVAADTLPAAEAVEVVEPPAFLEVPAPEFDPPAMESFSSPESEEPDGPQEF